MYPAALHTLPPDPERQGERKNKKKKRYENVFLLITPFIFIHETFIMSQREASKSRTWPTPGLQIFAFSLLEYGRDGTTVTLFLCYHRVQLLNNEFI